ncbi:MAG: pantoate--beta-alanine ligase [Caldimicrobium sp.]|nr:pantoate--beta-alanine ligase [Caldimicrobium sp.]MDW8183527.1 pantoate--beta-alanine ligase [Caldimicrobium sp.]
MEIVKSKEQMKAISRGFKKEGYRIGFVPTMGYLHEGHLSLIRLAKCKSDRTVVSIFVNPLQFGPNEDFQAYPRDLERDIPLLEKEGVDILFVPEVEDIYPADYQTYVEVTHLSSGLCGAFRSGHFKGVATILLKLFNIVKPDLAVFGEKDYQQIRVVEQMVKDLDLDMEILRHPIVREEDGLAMSSRNTYLSSEERRSALSLYQALKFVERLILGGERDLTKIRELTKEYIESFPHTKVQYVEIVHPHTLQSVEEIRGPVLVALAVFVGKTRLIDNKIIDL